MKIYWITTNHLNGDSDGVQKWCRDLAAKNLHDTLNVNKVKTLKIITLYSV